MNALATEARACCDGLHFARERGVSRLQLETGLSSTGLLMGKSLKPEVRDIAADRSDRRTKPELCVF